MVALAQFVHHEPLRNRRMQRIYRQLKFFGRQCDFVALWVSVVSQNARETTLIWDTRDDDEKRALSLPYTATMVDNLETRIIGLPSAFENGFSMLIQYAAQRGALWQKGRFLAK